MYETVRGALASDDAQEQRGEDPRFRVRATPAWNAADLEERRSRAGGVPLKRGTRPGGRVLNR
jgi:hypothetical protein